jgi:hypothetical protein
MTTAFWGAPVAAGHEVGGSFCPLLCDQVTDDFRDFRTMT